MMGPGFGAEIGRTMVMGMIVAIVAAFCAGAIVWSVVAWAGRHLSLVWSS